MRAWCKGSTSAPVDLWADQSGNGNNASQTAVANQPSWIPGTINGLPVVRFNGSNNFVNLPGFLTGMPQAEVFVVLKVAATNVAHGLWNFGGSGSGYNQVYTGAGGYIQEDFGSTSYYNLGTPAQPADAIPCLSGVCPNEQLGGLDERVACFIVKPFKIRSNLTTKAA